jgi:hypothetical protein
MSQDSTAKTGTKDATYNIVSILYHSLQGADLYEEYIRDAEQSGENDLVQFFREAQEENRRRAERAKEILGQRLSMSKDEAARH